MSNGMKRSINKKWQVKAQQKSPIHKVGLVLEPGHWSEYDPFLMLAEDWFQRGVFDIHPHRGIETVTYVIEGHLEHYDNKTGEGQTLGPGDVQWMTAGRGVVHLENPVEGETVHSLQLWINLPASAKMAEPRYQNLLAGKMPVRKENGATIRVFSGTSGNVKADTLNHVPVTMVEMLLDKGATISQSIPSSYKGFLYVLEGKGEFGEEKTEGLKNDVLWLGTIQGDGESEIDIKAVEPLRVLLYAGEPLKEPVVAYGPFVMNTKEQIAEAISDYNQGKFI